MTGQFFLGQLTTKATYYVRVSAQHHSRSATGGVVRVGMRAG